MARQPSTSISQATASKGILTEAEHNDVRTQGIERLLSLPFHAPYLKAKNDLSLSAATGFATHQTQLEQLAASLVDALADEMLGLRRMPDIATSRDVANYIAPREHALEALTHYIQTHWKDLWQQQAPPFSKKDTSMHLEEHSNHIVHSLLYPPYTIPIQTKLEMYDRALQHAFAAPYESGTLKDSELMHDSALIETIEEALRELSDERLRSKQTRTVKLADAMIMYGETSRPTFTAERDWHHAIQTAVRNTKGIDTSTIPTDVYDVFAELEARIGTEKTALLGADICQRFIDSLDRSIARFEKTHHLMEPFYYKGQTPSF